MKAQKNPVVFLPGYKSLVEDCARAPMYIDTWYERIGASKQIKEKLESYHFITVTSKGDFREPFSIIDENQASFQVFYVNMDTDQGFIAERVMLWIEERVRAILDKEINFLYIEDTKGKRFIHYLERWGLKDVTITRTTEKLYSRANMLDKLQEMGDNIDTLILPATIDEIRVYGS